MPLYRSPEPGTPPGGSTAQVLAKASGADFDTEWADQSGGGGGALDYVLLGKSNQSVSDQSVDAVAWTTETEDASGYHDNATNTDRLTIPTGKGGLFMVSAFVSFEPNSSGSRSLLLDKNGSNMLDLAYAPNPTDLTTMQFTTQVRMAAGDYLSLRVYQSSGVSLNMIGSRSSLSLIRLGV